jgi:hypothetical protein
MKNWSQLQGMLRGMYACVMLCLPEQALRHHTHRRQHTYIQISTNTYIHTGVLSSCTSTATSYTQTSSQKTSLSHSQMQATVLLQERVSLVCMHVCMCVCLFPYHTSKCRQLCCSRRGCRWYVCMYACVYLYLAHFKCFKWSNA